MGLEFVVQDARRNIQVRRGVFLHPMCALQGLDQGVPFDVLQRDTVGRQADDPILWLTCPRTQFPEPETIEAHHLFCLPGHPMCNGAFQFTQVARPGIL